MATSTDFADEVVERLQRVASAVRARRMFGGVGIYSGEQFFAIVAYDRLWLKVDDSNRSDFESRGMPPFRPFPDRSTTMSYYELPTELLSQPDELQAWVARSLAAARRTAKSQRRPKPARAVRSSQNLGRGSGRAT